VLVPTGVYISSTGFIESSRCVSVYPLTLPPTLPPLNTWDVCVNKQEHHYWQPLVWVSGLVQTLLYADFFYYYWIALKEGSKFQLPG